MTATFAPWSYVATGGRAGYTLISDVDLPLIEGLALTAKIEGGDGRHKPRLYVSFLKEGRTVRLHRFLLDAPDHLMGDHVNGNGLDNRRENLRLVTPSENSINASHSRGRSLYRGVTFHKGSGRYQAQINMPDGKRYLGLYGSASEAAAVYDEAARCAFGKSAMLNFPDVSFEASTA